MRTKQTHWTGAFGVTEVSLAPTARRAMLFDVTNCPHCGVHHASLDAEMTDDRIIVRCPATGGRPLVLIAKLFLVRLT